MKTALEWHICKGRVVATSLVQEEKGDARGRGTPVWQRAKIGQICCWQQSMNAHPLSWKRQLYLQRNGILVMDTHGLIVPYISLIITLATLDWNLFNSPSLSRLASRSWISSPLHSSKHRTGFNNLENKDKLNYFFNNAFHKLKIFMSTDIHLKNFLFK